MLHQRRALFGLIALSLVAAVFGATRCMSSGQRGGGRGAATTIAAAPTAIGRVRTIAEENALPGSTGWMIARPSLDGEIQAYTGEVSVQRGDTLGVYVSTKGGARFEADVYRMGWYGGAGARSVLSMRDVGGEDQGRWTPKHGLQGCKTCTLDPSTLLVEANWKRDLQIKVHPDWVSGYYLIKLEELATRTATYAIFVVRDDASRAPAIVQASTNTWQAYNHWGDASLYGSFTADRKYVHKTRRAHRVSYDRPYDPRINDSKNYGAGEFFSWEYNFVRWAESMGYEMTYTTNVDVSQRPETLLGHRLFISLGHDEYWTGRERDAAESARDAGINLAFFGGNEAYWQGRLEPSATGEAARVLTVYKDARLDPLARTQPKEATVLFAAPPVSRPQSLLSGLAYGSNATPDYQPWRAAGTGNWVFERTGILAGERFPGIVGYEYDRMAPPKLRPAGLAVVGSSPVTGFMGRDTAASTIYRAASGAEVFAAGTIAWSWGLDDYGHAAEGRFADQRLRRLTANIMDRLAAPPPATTSAR
ncbi:MAG: N,N-dimethylformamidase beta subunit family domain-containing protein [Dehalococcoidia bacterium]